MALKKVMALELSNLNSCVFSVYVPVLSNPYNTQYRQEFFPSQLLYYTVCWRSFCWRRGAVVNTMAEVGEPIRVRGVSQSARWLEEVEFYHQQEEEAIAAKLPRLESRLEGHVDSFDIDSEGVAM